jgi:hypothetical protein
MHKIETASGCEAPGGYEDQILDESDVWFVRSRRGYRAQAPMGVNRAAASKNVAGGAFSNRVLKGTIGRGRGQNLGPEIIA